MTRTVLLLAMTLPLVGGLSVSSVQPTKGVVTQEVGYHGNIDKLVQEKCLPCHREGGVGPFKLDSYTEVKKRGAMLNRVIAEGIMPPWFAKESAAPFMNDSSLTKEEKQRFASWVSAGMPEGDRSKASKAPTFVADWTIGKPDAEFKIPQPVKIPAEGILPYKIVDVPTNFTEDKWVEKIEVLPGDRSVVHHVLVFARTPGANRLEDQLEGVGGYFGIYVPGNSALVYGNGLAKQIPKGAVLRFQIHYTTNGAETTDQTKIGLVFAKSAPKQEVRTGSLANLAFFIPAKANNHRVEAKLEVPTNVQILSFLPHMHLRGKAAKYELLDANGSKKTLLDVPKYDFNWQLNYVLKKPLPVSGGQSLIYTAWYDNSAENPANPNPNKLVTWGEQTDDEMHLGYVDYIVTGEKPGEGKNIIRPSLRNEARNRIEEVFNRLDRNKDGTVTEAEAGAFWSRIKAADANGDGKLTLDEAKKGFGG